MTDDERATCATLAARLHAHAALAQMGLAQSILAALLLAWFLSPGPGLHELPLTPTLPLGALSAVGLLGLFERYLALRLRLDARLFDSLARGTIGSLAALDTALHRLGLRPRPAAAEPVLPPPPRSLDNRVQGTRRLLRRHGMIVAAQCALLGLALLTLDLM